MATSKSPAFIAEICILALLVCFSACYALLLHKNELFHTDASGIQKKYAVIIDPGHGGVDGGAVGIGGIVEKGINLSISLKLRSFFEAAGYHVIMTREDDRSIHDEDANSIRMKKKTDLQNRLGIIDENPDTLFISIHQNIYSSSIYSGTQVFYSPNNEASKAVALTVQQDIQSLLQPQNERIIKMAGKNLYLLYNAKSPAVMVECGFLSNPAEAALLAQDSYQNKMAYAIFYSVLHYNSGNAKS